MANAAPSIWFGAKIIIPYRYIWAVLLFVGAVANLGIVWLIADTSMR